MRRVKRKPRWRGMGRWLLAWGALGSCSGCQPGANYAEAIAEPIGVALDTGKGFRSTVIEGVVSQERDRFVLPVASAAVELWSEGVRVSATHADLQGHYAFSLSLSDGEYSVEPQGCSSSAEPVKVLLNRRLTVNLSLPAQCGGAGH